MRSMMAVVTCLVLAPFTLALSAEEQTIKKADVPSAVIAAFEKAYPKATVKSSSMEQEEGKTTYEIKSTDGSIRREIEYSAQGDVLEIEETMKPSDLPSAVSQAVAKRYPTGVIVRAEKKIEGAKPVTYEVKVRQGNEKIEVHFNLQGEVVPDKD